MRYLFFSLILLSLIAPGMASADDAYPQHELNVRFEPDQHRIIGVSRIVFPAGREQRVHIGGLHILGVSSQGLEYRLDEKTGMLTVAPPAADNFLAITYEAVYGPEGATGQQDGIEQPNLIAPEGVALTGSWYPAVDGLVEYSLQATLPGSFEGISEADRITAESRPDGTRLVSFHFGHPLDSISLIAGAYRLQEVQHGNITLAAYFFPEDEALGEQYLSFTRKYIDRYEKLIGPYPYRRFAIVENILPTGYSLPTFTLLGRDVVRLPFIVETSLGHEVLHQWFGNAVAVDRQGGNWAEGLTTYLADQQFEEDKGAGWEYRKQALVSYGSYITPETDFSLKEFTSRSDRATAAVGYGKTAMVFHMLKLEVGPDAFEKMLKDFFAKHRYGRASWDDLQKAAETAAGTDLAWFFTQWVAGKGAIDFQVRNIRVSYEGSTARISFEVAQQERKDRFLLPVLLTTDQGEVRKSFRVDTAAEQFEMTTTALPRELVIDGSYDLFRRLDPGEAAPVVSMILGDARKIFVVPSGEQGKYQGVSPFLKERGFTEKAEDEITYDDIKGSSLVIPGEAGLVRRLFAKTELPAGDFSFAVKFSPYSREHAIGILRTDSVPELGNYLRRVSHYGRYTTLAFSGGRATVKDAAKSDRGLRFSLEDSVQGVAVAQLEPLAKIIERVGSKDIIYVGEYHDRFDNHRVQLQVIRELFRKDPKLAIGMEMFQQPFQEVLDAYIAGSIDEKTFLKKTQYFKRWAFDYGLYREILLFAREHAIPVIALNIRKEIVSKVSKGGLQALGADERKEVPTDMDLADSVYRDRLKETFFRHASPESRNFDFFYQSQVLWDESMAHSLDGFMQKNPGYRVVVLAGVGHMAFGSGIPKRAHRLNGRSYAVLLNSEEAEPGIADYVLMPTPIAVAEAPKIGVQLRDDSGKLQVDAVSPGSLAEEAGLRQGDTITALDGEKMENIDDMKIHMLYKKKGDSLTVRITRKRFLFGPKEMELSMTL